MEISTEEARRFMVGHSGLAAKIHSDGAEGVRSLLARRRCIQLDPLDPMGTNADLVALARVDGIGKGDVHRHLHPGHAFEHFAKERCILPAEAFPYYRDQLLQTPWWRLKARLKRLPESLISDVLAEIEETGPTTAAALESRGRVEPLDWSGWKGTSKASTMAVEVLWTRCKIVVCGRTPGGKLYDVPRRALPNHHDITTPTDYPRWALLARAEACGLLARADGPWWSMMGDVRKSDMPDQLIEEGLLTEVRVKGSTRRYLMPTDALDRDYPAPDDRMRILGPLDPMIWDRKLTRQIFGFEYIWEVYKPKEKRRWGWYVCPLLHRGELVGRFEGRIKGGQLVVERIWEEPGKTLDYGAFNGALERHAKACGVRWVSVEGPS